MRSFGFLQEHEKDHCWAHPIDGLVAYVDLTAGPVDRIIDAEAPPVPSESSGNFDDPEVQGPPLDTLKPIEITQPEGRSFTSRATRCGGASGTCGSGSTSARASRCTRSRSTGGRSSTARPSPRWWCPTPTRRPVRFWQNYFDNGEYMLARGADSLQLGCDCLGDITYLDAVIADDLGAPKTIQNAICIHEEDYGVLWKHSDLFTGAAETRRQRRLVISFFTPIGNYDYGFYWYLYLDGTIQLEAQGHRHRVHRRRTGGTDGTPPRSRPGSARRSTSTCSRPGWT